MSAVPTRSAWPLTGQATGRPGLGVQRSAPAAALSDKAGELQALMHQFRLATHA